MTQAQKNRLNELETLDYEGAPLTPEDYAEMRELLNVEDADFVARHPA